ncbi:MAG: hypothetical protein JNK36_02520 [Bacteroidia bacterium]|nr:hypothetical protein [Bacteroidia bacterium]MBP8667988.1 hypothetical protein [Bacteroidia bacterium]HOZ82368.1 hypothetical protein [Bacteroidia bacterium]HOZ89803.1 hypothetical protein [Bacteroidia bacterium]HQX69545.1 hypothetical protein [Bacteroidia bacterium]
MLNRFFSVVTYLTHPLLIPTYLLLILFNSDTYLSYTLSPALQRIILSAVFVLTCLMPFLSSVLLLKKQGVQGLLMEDRQSRTIPYFFTLIYYVACYYFLLKLPVSSVIKILILAAACCIALAFTINFFWKISIHLIGLGGMAGAFYVLSLLLSSEFILPFVLSIILAGLTASARLMKNAHSPSQLYFGFIAGFVCEYIFIMYSLK